MTQLNISFKTKSEFRLVRRINNGIYRKSDDDKLTRLQAREEPCVMAFTYIYRLTSLTACDILDLCR